jgi:hypothetical protein
MAQPGGAFKANSVRIFGAVKETGKPDRPPPPVKKSERSKFVQEI